MDFFSESDTIKNLEAYVRPCKTVKMERSAKIVNGF